MATATMAWEARKAAACGCIGRAEAPRRPPEWRRSRCCTVVHSIGAPDLVCSGIRGLRGYHPEPNLPGRSPPPLRPAARVRPSAARSCCGASCSASDLCSGGAEGFGESMGSGGGRETVPTGNGLEIYKFLFEPSDQVSVAWMAGSFPTSTFRKTSLETECFYRVQKHFYGSV